MMPPVQEIRSWHFLISKYPSQLSSVTWKCLGTTATQLRSSRPHKLMEWGQWMLRCIVQRDCQLSAESITTDLHTSCGLQISSRTACKVLYGMGFEGRRTSLGLVVARRIILVMLSVNIDGEEDYFSGALNASAYQNILYNSSFQLCGNSLELFLFRHDCAPMHKARSLNMDDSLVWMNLILLQKKKDWFDFDLRALLTNWSGDWEPGLLIQHQWVTSQMGFWENFQKFPKTHMLTAFSEVNVVIAAKGVLTSYSTL